MAPVLLQPRELWSRSDTPLCHWASGGDPAAADEGRYVRVLWNGAPVRLACAESSDGVCTLADFKSMVAPLLVQDFSRECQPRVMRGPEIATADREKAHPPGATPAFNR